MSPRGSRVLAALAIGALWSLVTPLPSEAQPSVASAGLTVRQITPIGAVPNMTSQAFIRFSEAMAPADVDPEAPAFLDYVHVTPAVPVVMRWLAADTLTVVAVNAAGEPRSFPYSQRITIRVDAGARALSGARLGAPVVASFTTPAPTVRATGFRQPDGRVALLVMPSQPLRPEDVARYTAVRYQPFRNDRRAPDGDERRALARVDPSAPARLDAAVRRAHANAALRRIVPTRRLDSVRAPDGTLWQSAPYVHVVETIEVPPAGTRLLAGPPPHPVKQGAQPEPIANRVIALEDPFSVSIANCTAVCEGADVALRSTRPVDGAELRRAVRVIDLEDPAGRREIVAGPPPQPLRDVSLVTLSALGFLLRPGHRYEVIVDGALTSKAGERLPASWLALVQINRPDSLATVGARGDAVFEARLGPRLPVVAQSLRDVLAGVTPVPFDSLWATLASLSLQGGQASPAPSMRIPVERLDDPLQVALVDATPALAADGTGLLWLDVLPGTPLPSLGDSITVRPGGPPPSRALVQVTNLGLTVRPLAGELVILVTALDTGEPVPGASVTAFDGTEPIWRGTTDAQGLARTADGTAKPGTARLVVVEHDGDRAYAETRSDSSLAPGPGELVGSLLTDRGIYRPGDAVTVKAVVRSRTAAGLERLPAGTPLTLTLDLEDKRLLSVPATVGELGGAEWSVPLAADAELSSDYVLTVHRGAESPPVPYYPYWRRPMGLSAGIAVKAIRPLEFETSATLTADRADSRTLVLDLAIAAQDLTGVPLARGTVSWRLLREDELSVATPPGLEAFVFDPPNQVNEEEFPQGTGVLENGVFRTRLSVEGRFLGGTYYVEGEVVDAASSQSVALSHAIPIRPDVVLGLAPPAAPVEPGQPATVRVVAIDRDGRPVAGIPVRVDGVKATTGPEPVSVTLRPRDWGAGHTVNAEGDDPARWVMETKVYIPSAMHAPTLGPLPTLTLDRKSYRIGDRARVTVGAPWPKATVLVTVERETLKAAHVLTLHGETQTIEVPIDESAAGGLTVYATAVKGRTAACCEPDGDDPGAPAIVTTNEELAVDAASSRLRVAIEPDPAKPMAGSRTRLRVAVADDRGQPVADADVTLWAVDEGWLRLTSYELPDIVQSLVATFVPGYWTRDSRMWLLRRALPPPVLQTVQTNASQVSAAEPNDGAVRSGMRPLAFWFGSLRTDAAGNAEAKATLPDTLTTYRVMAIAADRARFGQATRPLVAARPLMLRTALPRALTRGDRATVRVTVASLLETPTRGRLSIESLTPELLAVEGDLPAVNVAAGARETVTVGVRALSAGVARLRVRVESAEGADALEQRLPIGAPTVVETTASFGEISGTALANVRLPAEVLPDAGGLSVSLSSSLLSGVALAGKDLDGYGYLCLEQRTSRLVALALAAGEGGPFAFAPIGGAEAKDALRRSLKEISTFRCTNAPGYGLWAGGACRVHSPYLAAYLLFALQRIHDQELDDIDVDDEIAHAAAAVEAALASSAPPTGGGPVHVSAGWRALAIKVLADADRFPAAAAETLLKDRAKLPVWAIAHLYDALREAEPDHEALPDLRMRLLNAITPAGAVAHVTVPEDGFDWTWPSETKTTAIVLDVLARRRDLEPERARALASWVLHARREGVWRSTQENAWALVALATYRHEIEGDLDDPVKVSARLGPTPLFDGELDREHEPLVHSVPLPLLRPLLGPAGEGTVTFTAAGSRPAFYTARLELHRPAQGQPALDHGLTIERRYRVVGRDAGPSATRVVAGDLVKVTLRISTPAARFLVALSDPLPAGFEAVDPELASTDRRGAWQELYAEYKSWRFDYPRFEHVQLRDSRVDLFATYLPAGSHEVSYLARATTPGTFFAPPPHAEAMYAPEVSGRGAGATITVTPTP